MPLPDEQLLQLLTTQGYTSEHLAEAQKLLANEKISLAKAVVKAGVIKDTDLGALIAAQLQLPFITLGDFEIPEQLLAIIPEEIAVRTKTVVFAQDDQGLKLATSSPDFPLFYEMLTHKTGLPVVLHYATELDLELTLKQYRTDFQKVFEKLLNEDDGRVITTASHDPPVRKMVDLLIETASKEQASDIHIEPQEDNTVVRFRIDGILYNIITLPKQLHERLSTRIKVMSRLRTDEHLAAQDGKISSKVDGERLDLRVSILPIADGEKIVMRLLSSKARDLSLSNLGMTDDDLEKVKKANAEANGMILVTGPTGSGKTTSIYTMLKTINTSEKNLTSIEDPIEYRMKGANQVQVNEKTNLTFANGLRSLLRQDPDYIFVGEIRDNETAGIAVNAALTGHLVFSTLHTNSAAASLPRLFDMKVEPFLVATTVQLIIAQRLVRKICDHCRISETITLDEMLKHLPQETINKHIIPVGKKKEIRIYRGQGCKACHGTGYAGRIGIYEILQITKTLRELITQRGTAEQIEELAVKEGMNTMLDDGVIKITKGLTTIEEVLRVVTAGE